MRRRIGMRSWRGGAKIFHRLTEFRVIFILGKMVEKSKDELVRLYSRGATRRPQTFRKFEIQATSRRLESTRQVNFPKIKEERRLEFCYETEGGRCRCNSWKRKRRESIEGLLLPRIVARLTACGSRSCVARLFLPYPCPLENASWRETMDGALNTLNPPNKRPSICDVT